MSASTSRIKIAFFVLTLVLGSFYVPAVLAQDQIRSEFDPGDALSFKLGETDLFPSIRIDYLANSNAFLNADDVSNSSGVTLSPRLTWVADRRLFFVVGRYIGAYNVSDEEALNFADHNFSVNANAELDARRRFKTGVSLALGHEPLGTNLTRGTADADSDDVQFARIGANGEFRYGAEGAKGNIAAGVELFNLNYTSRSDVTDGRSYFQFEPYAQFSYRIGGDTRLLTELRFASVSFDNSDRDRNDISLLAGMQFAATGKTGGSFSAGVLQSQNKNSLRSDQTEFVFNADLFWEPTSFSRFTFSGSREIDNEGSSLVVSDVVDAVRDSYGVEWDHRWSSRFSHSAQIRANTSNSACPERDIQRVTAGVEFNLKLNRWLTFGVNGNVTRREAGNCPGLEESDELDFERSLIGAHVRATL